MHMLYKITYWARNQGSTKPIPTRRFATTKRAADLVVEIAKKEGAKEIRKVKVERKVMYV